QRKQELENGNRFKSSETEYPMVDTEGITIEDEQLWNSLKENLTNNQWKWVHYFIIKEMPIKEIAHLENKSEDRKSTRLNSSHVSISYAVFCLKKKTD